MMVGKFVASDNLNLTKRNGEEKDRELIRLTGIYYVDNERHDLGKEVAWHPKRNPCVSEIQEVLGTEKSQIGKTR